MDKNHGNNHWKLPMNLKTLKDMGRLDLYDREMKRQKAIEEADKKCFAENGRYITQEEFESGCIHNDADAIEKKEQAWLEEFQKEGVVVVDNLRETLVPGPGRCRACSKSHVGDCPVVASEQKWDKVIAYLILALLINMCVIIPIYYLVIK